ncbi:MAG: FAD-dependent oxidoreductase [Lewinellaceae bacterium]|nr:FAD-dependent oxidoreductase [Lewinellaceae bacterium]
MNRANHLQKLRDESFDLCIIGGGASGAGCALDAALRGLKVALIEKTDFAAETSSRSTKLIHGGVRYLEQAFKNLDLAQLRQVRHGLEERHILLKNAPHLAQPLALITPVFSWWEGLYYSIGLALYDWFASGRDVLPRSRWLSKNETLQRAPGLSRHIHSAVLYHDGQIDDARYCLALIQSAAEAGAVVVNHTEVIDFEKDKSGIIQTAICRDLLRTDKSQQKKLRVNARIFLNCTGPFADHLRNRANSTLEPRIRPSKGVHLVLPWPILGSRDALLIPKTKDGRIIFAIPFENALLLGTTDTDCPADEAEPVLEAGEAEFLLNTLQPYVHTPLDPAQIRAGFGGLRPLITASKRHTKSLLRDHEVEHDPASNLLSLLGGKWTTYRLMAKDAVDRVCTLLGVPTVCRTESHLLPGAEAYEADFWKKIERDFGLEADISQHLALKYGTRALRVAALAKTQPELSERILPGYPFLRAEIVYSVREEMACTLRDMMARRMRLEITDWQAAGKAAPVVAGFMGRELGWTEAEKQKELTAYRALLDHFKASAGRH